MWLVVFALVGCSSKGDKSAPPAQEFPALSTPVGGVLAGKPFKVSKMVFRDGARGQRLELYAQAKGDACAYQSAFGVGNPYLQVALGERAARLEVGKPRNSGLLVIYKRSGAGKGKNSARLVLDSVDKTNKLVVGRLIVSADDDTDVRGQFRAAYCTNDK